MNKLQKYNNNYPVNLDANFIKELVQGQLNNEPKRENNFLSNIFSKRVTNNFIRIKIYEHCTFYLGKEDDD